MYIFFIFVKSMHLKSGILIRSQHLSNKKVLPLFKDTYNFAKQITPNYNYSKLKYFRFDSGIEVITNIRINFRHEFSSDMRYNVNRKEKTIWKFGYIKSVTQISTETQWTLQLVGNRSGEGVRGIMAAQNSEASSVSYTHNFLIFLCDL